MQVYINVGIKAFSENVTINVITALINTISRKSKQ